MDENLINLKIKEVKVKYIWGSEARVLVNLDSNSLNVEDYVQKMYEKNGYSVVRGADFHLFLFFCTANFDEQIGRNWGGDEFVKLYLKNKALVNQGSIALIKAELIPNAQKMWVLYNQTFEPKKILSKLLGESLDIFSDDELSGLIKFYQDTPYDPKGASDLFVFKKIGLEKEFIEVKSVGDSLRYEQFKYAFQISKFVGNYFTVLYLLPNNKEEGIVYACLSTAEKHLSKLILVGFAKINEGLQNYRDFDTYALNQLGVNPNCLVFFLNKNGNNDVLYDSNKLDYQGRLFTLQQYIDKLQMKWEKCGTK